MDLKPNTIESYLFIKGFASNGNYGHLEPGKPGENWPTDPGKEKGDAATRVG